MTSIKHVIHPTTKFSSTHYSEEIERTFSKISRERMPQLKKLRRERSKLKKERGMSRIFRKIYKETFMGIIIS